MYGSAYMYNWEETTKLKCVLVVVAPAALSHPSIFTQFSNETNFNYLKTNTPPRVLSRSSTPLSDSTLTNRKAKLNKPSGKQVEKSI